MELLYTALLSLGINILMFIPAYLFKTDKLTDISYSLTFVILAGGTLLWSGLALPSLILFGMILLWAIRLGSYLLIRIHKMKKDARFDEMRENFWKFLGFWLLQGTTVWIVLLPSTLFFLNPIEVLPTWAWVGIAVWAIGLTIETFADLQKYQFINDPTNKGKWIDTGLWRYSRHPNYFGEITNWTGIYLFTLTGLSGVLAWIGIIGPLYIAALIIFVSGIPLLEKAADKRWGSQKEYQAYKSSTSVLIPLPSKK